MTPSKYSTRTYKTIDAAKVALYAMGWNTDQVIPIVDKLERGKLVKLTIYDNKEIYTDTSNETKPPGRLIIKTRLDRTE